MSELHDRELRQLPGIDTLVRAPELAGAVQRHGAAAVKEALRNLQAEWRKARTS